MKLRIAMALLMFLLFAAGLWGAESTTQLSWDSEFGNTLYNTPKGWSTTQKSGTQTLIPPDLAEGEQAGIIITPGGDLTGEFKDAFNDFRSALRGEAKGTESKTESVKADEGYAVLYTAEQILDDKGSPQQFRMFFGSNPGNRFEMVLFIANNDAAYKRYLPAMEEFVKTLAYKNVRPGAHATTAPSAPATQPTTKTAG
jgi:hypothetical protein